MWFGAMSSIFRFQTAEAPTIPIWMMTGMRGSTGRGGRR
jgi:hypothetical protein